VTAELGGDAGRVRPALDHAVNVRLRQCPISEPSGAPIGRAEQEAFGFPRDAGRMDIGIEPFLQRVVGGHLVFLAALFMQAHPPALADRVIVLHLHLERRADAGEGVEQRSNQCPIAQADQVTGIDRREQRFRFLPAWHVRFALGGAVARSAHGGGRVVRHDLANHQPVEQHPHAGELLLDGRRRPPFPPQVLHPGRDVGGQDCR